MDCKKERNLQRCKCTSEPCSRKGLCCECIKHHLDKRQLPACVFPVEAERTFNRSYEYFAELVMKGMV